ncbi:NACHT domain-containing protein [Herbidospora mongoliensis]|uniref:NACHT domain-containing protein n=1 Tax=Herbidospora mongoliensis TaxID=688067 RepID=UPI00082DB337|nr:NACHT domain-containing protein [Herbidospora mongoliensis]
MGGLEVAAISLGTAVVQSAMKLWLGDRALAAAAAENGINALSTKASGLAQQRATRRLAERMAETVALKIEPFVAGEIGSLPENEMLSALDLVRDTFEQAAFTDDDLFAADLDARYLDRHLPDLSRDLTERGQAFYLRVRKECCAYLVQTARALPTFQPGVLTELLRRDTAIIEQLETVLARLPEAPQIDFELDYRRQVGLALDHMELFGATLSETSRRYPLRLAYVELTLSSEIENDERSTEEIIGAQRRLLIRGAAGGGKTTLLRWTAVRAALKDLPPGMADLRGCVPFSIPLRQYVDQRLPAPSDFLDQVGRHIADEMPDGWVQRQLRAGNAILLIDGVDELPEGRRRDAHTWVQELIHAFPRARYVVTSRPGAVGSGWLATEEFVSYELQPMSPPVIRECVGHWHEAVAAGVVSADEKSALLALGEDLAESISRRGHLRLIASSPLLCALLCALNRDRNGRLPGNRMELYDVALDMLLERRGADQGLVIDMVLSKTVKMLFLRDIAYWLVRNGKSDAPREEVIERIRQKMPLLADLPSMSADQIYWHLLERSGLLREPVVGRVGFVHRTFQEDLAALEAVAQNDIGLLIRHAHEDQWREIIVMAAGHAFPPLREQLLHGILDRSDGGEHTDELRLLAVACLETSSELSPGLWDDIRNRAKELFPPRTISTARAISGAGDWALEQLAVSNPTTQRQVVATIRAAAEFGTDRALDIIVRFKNHPSPEVQQELIRAWGHFDVAEFARKVIRGTALSSRNFELTRQEMVPALAHLTDIEQLTVDLQSIGHLGFLRDLPRLATLNLLRLPRREIDLSPLSMSSCTKIEVPWHYDPEVTRGWLSAFRNMPNLERLELWGIAGLLDLTPLNDAGIVGLSLHTGHYSVFRVVQARLPQLRALHLQGFRDLDLYGLSAPSVDSLSADRSLQSLHGVERFPDLRELTIHESSVIDVRRLAGLRLLERVTISGPGVIRDVSPFAEIPTLRFLEIAVSDSADPAPLARRFSTFQVVNQEKQRLFVIGH